MAKIKVLGLLELISLTQCRAYGIFSVIVRNPLLDDPELASWYEPALRYWVDNGVVEEGALACNWLHDHRISAARARRFHEFVVNRIAPSGPPLSPVQLERAISEYYETKIRTVGFPAFLYPCNFVNIVYGHPDLKDPLPGGLALGRVLNISRLHRVIAAGRRDGISEFQDVFPAGRGDEPLTSPSADTWALHAATALAPMGARAEEFVFSVLRALNAYGRRYPYQPSWAAKWAVMVRYLNQRPEEWCGCVGVPVFDRDWIIVLRYTVSETGTLLRPTQIDAGTQPYHFPSPPKLSVHEGGLAMHLENTCPELVPEFVHQQIVHSEKHWLDSGMLCRQVIVPHRDTLKMYRTLHYERLLVSLGLSVQSWMKWHL